ncbi:DivIVA domain-containing protein [Glycomyces sambucus]|uniref:DivIVA domain-containing protein n=1 Tax=Glycomyces sambucus TaxID=380244 RepID=A0A1G9J6B5_9ACTN|nr:DivIVA domain-containing protein [Glycomyces sambucus]SDL33078.1 DivIVA domain-containing protein [Glycomyces sambucus]
MTEDVPPPPEGAVTYNIAQPGSVVGIQAQYVRDVLVYQITPLGVSPLDTLPAADWAPMVASSPMLTLEQLRFAHLPKPAPGEPGYAEAEVNAFLDEVEAALGLDQEAVPLLTQAEVRYKQFKPTYLRTSYAPEGVDLLLDKVESEIARRWALFMRDQGGIQI